MTENKFWPLAPQTILAGAIIALPLLIVSIFPGRLMFVMNPASYLIFHNIVEFFSIMVSLSMFGLCWFTYDQSKDRHALFLGTSFLAIGLMDFMHTMSMPAMPDFITPNYAQKSVQFWIPARLFQAVVFLASAYVYPDRAGWLSKRVLLTTTLLVTFLVFSGIIFFPAYMPTFFVAGTGVTPLKKFCEYLIILLFGAAAMAYGLRIQKTGERVLFYYQAAFVISIFSELPLAFYARAFDTYNVMGHIFKPAAFFVIYYGIYRASVRNPYLRLTEARDGLQSEVAERKRAEDALRKIQQELEERTANLSAALRQLEMKNKELQDFSFVASHDMREPLRKIQAFGGMIRDHFGTILPDQGKDYLTRMQNAANRMDQLLTSLLNYSRISTRGKPFTPTNLSDLAREVLADLKIIEEKGARVEFEDLPIVEVDPPQIRQLFGNLIQNGIKFNASSHPEIRIHGETHDGLCRIFVRDNGIGFDEQYLDKIFSPFQRLHGRSEYEGMGMGLAICHKIVERHGGSLTARSNPGEGSTFIVTLPLKQPSRIPKV